MNVTVVCLYITEPVVFMKTLLSPLMKTDFVLAKTNLPELRAVLTEFIQKA